MLRHTLNFGEEDWSCSSSDGEWEDEYWQDPSWVVDEEEIKFIRTVMEQTQEKVAHQLHVCDKRDRPQPLQKATPQGSPLRRSDLGLVSCNRALEESYLPTPVSPSSRIDTCIRKVRRKSMSFRNNLFNSKENKTLELWDDEFGPETELVKVVPQEKKSRRAIKAKDKRRRLSLARKDRMLGSRKEKQSLLTTVKSLRNISSKSTNVNINTSDATMQFYSELSKGALNMLQTQAVREVGAP